MVLLPGCACCGCSEECCRTRYYGYHDTEPPGKWYDECPNVGNCAEGELAVLGDCANEVIEGYIVERFCKQSIAGKEIRAYLRKNSTLDDFGTIAGIDTTESCGSLGIITADHDITDELEFEDDGAYLLAKVPIRVENSQIGGPLGAAGVVICWCCIDPEDPPVPPDICPCCQGPPPPPPPECCCVTPTGEEYGTPYQFAEGYCVGEGYEPIVGPPCLNVNQWEISLSATWCGLSIETSIEPWPGSLYWTRGGVFENPPWSAGKVVEGDNCTRDIVLNTGYPPVPCVNRGVYATVIVYMNSMSAICTPSRIGVSITGYIQTITGGQTFRVSDDTYLGSAQPWLKSYTFAYNSIEGTMTLTPDLDNTSTGENWCGNSGHYICDEDDPVVEWTSTLIIPPNP